MKVKLYKFKDIVVGQEGLLKGPFGSDLKKTLYVPKGDDTYKVYLQENILKQNNICGSHYISSEYFNTSMSRYEVKEGDFIVTCDGTLGEIFQLTNIKEKGIISSSLLRITLDSQVVNHIFFKYFWLYRIKNPLIRSHENSVLKHLPGLNVIRNFEFEIPELPTQKSIAKVLSDLDTKIELNNRINLELEAMAKMLYDYWFVQFDFPNEQGKPYKSSGGKMVYNAEMKREIPEGWEVKNIFKVCKIQYGFPFSTNYFNTNGNGVPVIRIRDILENSISNYSSEPNIDIKYLIKKGDLLVGMDGNFHINYWSKEGCYLNQRAVKLSETLLPNLYLKYQIEPFIKLREKSVSRTTVGHLSDKDLKSLNILIPSKEVLASIKSIYKNVLERIIQTKNENQQLSELRDWLLPMLMNGQVTVKEAEERLSMAAEPEKKYTDFK